MRTRRKRRHRDERTVSKEAIAKVEKASPMGSRQPLRRAARRGIAPGPIRSGARTLPRLRRPYPQSDRGEAQNALAPRGGKKRVDAGS